MTDSLSSPLVVDVDRISACISVVLFQRMLSFVRQSLKLKVSFDNYDLFAEWNIKFINFLNDISINKEIETGFFQKFYPPAIKQSKDSVLVGESFLEKKNSNCNTLCTLTENNIFDLVTGVGDEKDRFYDVDEVHFRTIKIPTAGNTSGIERLVFSFGDSAECSLSSQTPSGLEGLASSDNDDQVNNFLIRFFVLVRMMFFFPMEKLCYLVLSAHLDDSKKIINSFLNNLESNVETTVNELERLSPYCFSLFYIFSAKSNIIWENKMFFKEALDAAKQIRSRQQQQTKRCLKRQHSSTTLTDINLAKHPRQPPPPPISQDDYQQQTPQVSQQQMVFM